MIIAILAGEELKAEILRKKVREGIEYIWPDSLNSLLMVEADYYFDFKFEMDPERISRLKRLFPKPVFVGAVNDTLAAIGDDRFIRINDWPGMMERNVIELAFSDKQHPTIKLLAEETGWQFISVPDIIGMVTPRIIAMIVNEAFFALEEGVSTRAEIDTAMKLGTSYPYGPFEWSEKIGSELILTLLKSLQGSSGRYQVAGQLVSETPKTIFN
ncbi:MAG: hypothetical protein EOO04_26345 [Chitinophagaceae bacterium]|nr:MAG: hypothetical protein EOO04_26345 [Chitinophagaceae bacterium]